MKHVPGIHLLVFIACFVLSQNTQASSLKLGSGKATPGESVSIPVTFAASGNEAASIGWTFTFSSSDFSGAEFTLGPAAVAAGKELACREAFAGSITCLITGLNDTSIGDGIVATATMTVARTATSPNAQLGMSELGAASPAADSVIIDGVGGAIDIALPVQLSSLSCSPASVSVGKTSSCNVTLSGPAPAGGVNVSLGWTSSQTVGITMPTSLNIPEGTASASFQVAVNSATATSSVSLSATSNSATKQFALSVSLPTPISVSVTPATATLSAAQTRQFTASVTGASSGVTWTLTPAVGTVVNGLYKAPNSVSAAQVITVRATSVADTTKFATATVNLVPPVPPTDTTAPVISSMAVSPGSNSAVISWTTNEPATCKVVYGTSSAALNQSATDSTLTKSARINLSGLTPSTTYYYRVIATDAALNSATLPATLASFQTADNSTTPPPSSNSIVIWPTGATPALADDGDAQSVELGLRFSSDVAGKVVGLRFYKGVAKNGGTHVGNLWSSSGQKLASVTFTNESASGWQTAFFQTPVSITPNATYTISYLAPQGHYSVTENALTKATHSGPLHVPTTGGVYKYGSTSRFPTDNYRASNYWVDVIVTPEVNFVVPTTVAVVTGSLKSGSSTSLTSNDSVYLQVNSTTAYPFKAEWTTTFGGVPNAATSLDITYSGKSSRTCSETISVWSYKTSGWVSLQTRSAPLTEEMRTISVTGTVADYISGTTGVGDVLLKVGCSTTSGSFSISGDLIRLSYK